MRPGAWRSSSEATADVISPQALDYWMRVKWHLDRGDSPRPAISLNCLRPEAPRLLLIARRSNFILERSHPALHGAEIEVERIGLAPAGASAWKSCFDCEAHSPCVKLWGNLNVMRLSLFFSPSGP
jgi:hypothetical protein